jgi:hypothetical protein
VRNCTQAKFGNRREVRALKKGIQALKEPKIKSGAKKETLSKNEQVIAQVAANLNSANEFVRNMTQLGQVNFSFLITPHLLAKWERF